MVLINKDIQLFYGCFGEHFEFDSVQPMLIYSPSKSIDLTVGTKRLHSKYLYVAPGQHAIVQCEDAAILLIHHTPLKHFEFEGQTESQGLVEVNSVVQKALYTLASCIKERGCQGFGYGTSFDFIDEYLESIPTGDAKDPRMISLLEDLYLTSDEPTPISTFFEKYDLSKSRFSFLFKKEFGVSATTMRQWMRLCRCVLRYSQQPDATRGAYESGFADYAQYSRVFKKMLGRNPCRFKHTPVYWASSSEDTARVLESLGLVTGRMREIAS